MGSKVEKRLRKLGLEVPTPASPVANYVPFVISGRLVFVSGQVPLRDGRVAVTGKLGDTVSLEDGAQAARICGLNIIAQLKAACGGDLDKVKRIVKLNGFVASAPGFTDQPKVINGASDLMVEAFGEAGRHARAAVGCPSLPLDSAVEVDAVAEIG